VKKKNSLIPVAAVMSLTLGLAPFAPEPHIVGKLKWVFGGAQGMQIMDYFDLLLHGSPWVFLIYAISAHFIQKKKA
jgi:hypothetical protein